MELEGSLKAFPLPEVLQFLGQQKMTGVLTVSREETVIHLEIQGGRIVNSSTMARFNKLGQMLVSRNVIPRRVLEETLALQQAQNNTRLLGELLIERNVVTEEQLWNTVQLQTEEDIWDLFGWRAGNFKFEHRSPDEMATQTVDIEIEPLLLEGTRRMDEWQRIAENIADDHVVFRVTPPPEDRNNLPNFALEENQWEILSLINGRFSVGSLISRTSFGTFDTYSILNSLLAAGLISEANPRSEPPKQEPESRIEGEARSVQQIAAASAKDTAEGPRNGQGKFWGVSGFLGRKKVPGAGEIAVVAESPAPLPQRTDVAAAVSPISVISNFLNCFLASLRSDEQFDLGAHDNNLLSSLWNGILDNCPKADLIVSEGSKLRTEEMDAFVSLIGETPEIQGVYEDALEALGRLTNRLTKLASQRLGEKETRRLLDSAIEKCRGLGQPALFSGFDLKEFVRKANA